MNCDQLDDYLCRLLKDEDAAAFESHAVECDLCSLAIVEDQELLSLLQTASLRLEKPVASFVVRSSTPSVASFHEPSPACRSSGLAVGVSIAALLFLMVMIRSPSNVHPSQPIENFGRNVAESVDSVPAPTVQVGPGFSQFHVSSTNPDVQIYMVVSKTPTDSNSVAP